jgi:hypothetical protein
MAARVRTDGFVDKHDGYRLIVHRDGKAVRLFTRRGYFSGHARSPQSGRAGARPGFRPRPTARAIHYHLIK